MIHNHAVMRMMKPWDTAGRLSLRRAQLVHSHLRRKCRCAISRHLLGEIIRLHPRRRPYRPRVVSSPSGAVLTSVRQGSLQSLSTKEKGRPPAGHRRRSRRTAAKGQAWLPSPKCASPAAAPSPLWRRILADAINAELTTVHAEEGCGLRGSAAGCNWPGHLPRWVARATGSTSPGLTTT
jgi:hypothetical protein